MKTKPFNLEEAKAGAKVVTKDGSPVRIICWDKKDRKYPLVGLVGQTDEKEICTLFTSDGISLEIFDNYDLFILEKEESEKNVPVMVHYNKRGEPDGILIRTLDEEFVLNLYDTTNFEGCATFTFSEAEKEFAFNLKQAKIISLYIDEIQKLLYIYGAPLRGTYWTSTKKDDKNVWYLCSSSELSYTFTNNKDCRLRVRSVNFIKKNDK